MKWPADIVPYKLFFTQEKAECLKYRHTINTQSYKVVCDILKMWKFKVPGCSVCVKDAVTPEWVETMEETSRWKPAAFWLSPLWFAGLSISSYVLPTFYYPHQLWYKELAFMLLPDVTQAGLHIFHPHGAPYLDGTFWFTVYCFEQVPWHKKAMILENQNVAPLQAVPEPDDRQRLVWSSWSRHTAQQTTADKI